MSTERHADVERYIGYFRGEHAKLNEIKHPVHRKVLVVTMLDALAQGRYPKRDFPRFGNRDRFINLIEKHSNWAHANSVSASQLVMTIDERGGAAACGAGNELIKRLDHWRRQKKPWQTQGLEIDPSSGDLLPQYLNEHELKLVDEAKHSSLLYVYRCVLVHEYREPGHGFVSNECDLTPSYHDVMDEDGATKVELVYPAGWFLQLVPPILESLAAFYMRTSYNPYDSYKFGSPWRKTR